MTKINSCPFCGCDDEGVIELVNWVEMQTIYYHCGACEASGPGWSYESTETDRIEAEIGALESWNERCVPWGELYVGEVVKKQIKVDRLTEINKQLVEAAKRIETARAELQVALEYRQRLSEMQLDAIRDLYIGNKNDWPQVHP